jgi:hypothetical protein
MSADDVAEAKLTKNAAKRGIAVKLSGKVIFDASGLKSRYKK